MDIVSPTITNLNIFVLAIYVVAHVDGQHKDDEVGDGGGNDVHLDFLFFVRWGLRECGCGTPGQCKDVG